MSKVWTVLVDMVYRFAANVPSLIVILGNVEEFVFHEKIYCWTAVIIIAAVGVVPALVTQTPSEALLFATV